ncbi:MAG: hypothetical protein ACREV2_14235, partial [Burkholderiales bacterium]
MNTVYFDSSLSDAERRRKLYDGQLFVLCPTESSLALCKFADAMIRDAFKPLDPEQAQHSFSVEEYATILTELKPKFINHPQSKKYLQGILREAGCDLNQTYFDVPRMRSATSGDHLKTGIAYAWHPHRDTWYSAPPCQLNWWMPVYALESENAMAFHPRYWDQPVVNDSAGYNYYQWNQIHRPSAAQHLKSDTRPLPRPLEKVEINPQLRLVPPVGGIIIFSGQQMHSTVPNTSGKTRYSIDFRTVNLEDVANKQGAKNIDSACTGTSLRDFLRGTDLTRIPEEIVALYN